MKFDEMTARQLSTVDRDRTVVLIPIAAVEQHGPHMPTGTDTIICTAVSQAVESEMASRVLLTPTLWLGASAHHLRFGSTFSAALPTYIEMLVNIAQSLLQDGFGRLLFVNGHGGNVDPMRVAVRRLQEEYPSALLAAGCYWSVAEDLTADTLQGDHKFVGHACEFETSMMLHLRPELIDQDYVADAGTLIPNQIDGLFLGRDMKHRTREGFTGRPDLATAERGKRLFEGIVERLVKAVERLAAQPLGTTYEDFVG